MRAHLLTRSLVTTLLPALALAGACGKTKPADTSGAAGGSGTSGAAGTTGAAGTSGNVLVTVSGVAAPHPLNKALLGEDEPFSMLEVAIVDPSAVIADPNAAPLGAMALDTSAGNCDPTAGCKWSLPGVNIGTPNLLGLVGELVDTRTGDGGDARVWVKTGTGMGSAADVATAIAAAPAPVTGRQAFAVSRKLEAALGVFAGKVLNQTFAPGDLEARGFLIGHVVDKLPADGSMPAGVAGATVSATGNFDVIYPAADFMTAGTTTSATGIFLMVPKAATSVVTNWSVVPPAGDARTWTPHLAGSNPGTAFVIILPAD